MTVRMYMHIKKIFFCILGFCTFASAFLSAAENGTVHESIIKAFGLLKDPNAALTSFRSLHIPYGGRCEAMGSAFTAMADDVSFFEYNPAASCVLEHTEAALFHNFWIADSAVDTAAFTRRNGNFGWGSALKSFYVPFTEYNIFGGRASKGYYSETTAAFNGSYNFLAGYTFKGIALGTNLKTSFRGVPDYSDNLTGHIISDSGLVQSGLALMADVGVLLRFNIGKLYTSRDPNFNIGFAMHNAGCSWTGFGKKVVLDDPLPTDFSAGIAYRIIENLVFTADFRQPLNMYNPKKSERWSIAAGTEVNITDFFALQAGILLKGANPKISFGSSLAWKKLSFNATYSLDLTSSLNPINKLSLAVKMDFGDEGRKVLQNRADKLYIEGIDYYTQGEFEKAIEKWKEVLVLFPRFDPAKQGITTAQNSIALRKKIRDVQKLY